MPTASIARPARRGSSRARRDAIARDQGPGAEPVKPGDVLVLIGRGPLGTGMEETYQVTSALKHLTLGQAGGGAHRRAVHRRQHRRLHRPRRPRGAGRRADRQIARRRPDRDRDRSHQVEGTIDLVGDGPAASASDAAGGSSSWPARAPRADLSADHGCPTTRLWAALQHASGGVWGGCVYDSAAIAAKLTA